MLQIIINIIALDQTWYWRAPTLYQTHTKACEGQGAYRPKVKTWKKSRLKFQTCTIIKLAWLWVIKSLFLRSFLKPNMYQFCSGWLEESNFWFLVVILLKSCMSNISTLLLIFFFLDCKFLWERQSEVNWISKIQSH